MNLPEKTAPEECAGTGIHEAMTVELVADLQRAATLPPVPSTEDSAADDVMRVLAASL